MEILNFLSSVKDICYFLNHTFNVVNESDHARLDFFLDHFENFFTRIPMKNSTIRLKYEKVTGDLKIEIESFESILKDGKLHKLENFMIENYLKKFGDKMMNFVFEKDFMVEISKIANEAGLNMTSGLKTTPQRAVYDFYIGAVLMVVKEHALFSKAAEKLGGIIFFF